MRIVTVAEMRELEQRADASGLSYEDMMERAGREVARVALEIVRPERSDTIVILAGPGNNGGDGLVAARYIAAAGYQVRVHLLKQREEDKNWLQVKALGIPYVIGIGEEALVSLGNWLDEATVVIDAVLGTGVRLPLDGAIRELIRFVGKKLVDLGQKRKTLLAPTQPGLFCNRKTQVIAVDVPTGLDADSGEVDTRTITADITVTMGLPKSGHFRMPGAARVGTLIVADIGIEDSANMAEAMRLLTSDVIAGILPPRILDAHKGTYGSALIVGGSSNYVGAPLLAAAGAARGGVGLVTIASIPVVLSSADSLVPEATRIVLPSQMGVIGAEALVVLEEYLERYDALVVGPGMTQEKEAVKFLEELIGQRAVVKKRAVGFLAGVEVKRGCVGLPPVVIDADALNILAANREWLKQLPGEVILTPHPGEMARLLNCEVGEVQNDRVAITLEAARAWNSVIVLKGAFTVIANADQRVSISPFATSALASGGTGDVLSGVIAAMLAQGMPAYEAACAAVYLHGLAGQMATDELGNSGVVASDLLPRLPVAQSLVRG